MWTRPNTFQLYVNLYIPMPWYYTGVRAHDAWPRFLIEISVITMWFSFLWREVFWRFWNRYRFMYVCMNLTALSESAILHNHYIAVRRFICMFREKKVLKGHTIILSLHWVKWIKFCLFLHISGANCFFWPSWLTSEDYLILEKLCLLTLKCL